MWLFLCTSAHSFVALAYTAKVLSCTRAQCHPRPTTRPQVPEALFEGQLPPGEVAKYHEYQLRSFVEESRGMAWCTGPACEAAGEGRGGGGLAVGGLLGKGRVEWVGVKKTGWGGTYGSAAWMSGPWLMHVCLQLHAKGTFGCFWRSRSNLCSAGGFANCPGCLPASLLLLFPPSRPPCCVQLQICLCA